MSKLIQGVLQANDTSAGNGELGTDVVFVSPTPRTCSQLPQHLGIISPAQLSLESVPDPWTGPSPPHVYRHFVQVTPKDIKAPIK